MNHLTRRNVMIGAGAALVASALPALPAIAAPAVVEKARKKFLMPSILWIMQQTKLIDERNNQITIIYHVMERWENVEGQNYPNVWTAPVDSDRYREWMVEFPPEDGIPHHIQNGGVIKGIPGGDPMHSVRWADDTRRRLKQGVFDHITSDQKRVNVVRHPVTGKEWLMTQVEDKQWKATS